MSPRSTGVYRPVGAASSVQIRASDRSCGCVNRVLRHAPHGGPSREERGKPGAQRADLARWGGSDTGNQPGAEPLGSRTTAGQAPLLPCEPLRRGRPARSRRQNGHLAIAVDNGGPRPDDVRTPISAQAPLRIRHGFRIRRRVPRSGPDRSAFTRVGLKQPAITGEDRLDPLEVSRCPQIVNPLPCLGGPQAAVIGRGSPNRDPVLPGHSGWRGGPPRSHDPFHRTRKRAMQPVAVAVAGPIQHDVGVARKRLGQAEARALDGDEPLDERRRGDHSRQGRGDEQRQNREDLVEQAGDGLEAPCWRSTVRVHWTLYRMKSKFSVSTLREQPPRYRPPCGFDRRARQPRAGPHRSARQNGKKTGVSATVTSMTSTSSGTPMRT